MLQIVEDVEAETVALRRWWAERRVDGVLLVDLRMEVPRVPLVEELGLPAVIAGGPGRPAPSRFSRRRRQRRVPDSPAPGDAGPPAHRPGGRFTGVAHTQLRTEVFEEVLAGAGAGGNVVTTDYSSSAGADATRQLLSGTPAPPPSFMTAT